VERYTPQRMARRARRETVQLARILRDTPYQIHDFLEQARDGQLEIGFVHQGLDEFMQHADVGINRLVVALVVVGGLLGSSILAAFTTNGPELFGIYFLAAIGFIASGVLGIWLLWAVLRSGRL
jgi:ubiquinone biosynthesis protein